MPMKRLVRMIVASYLLNAPFASGALMAADNSYRVAVIGDSPPMSYVDDNGKLTGFNIEMARALCETMQVRCDLVPTTLVRVVDAVSAGEMDFAVVSLLATPERRQKVLFSKPYYRSLSVWLSRPALKPGAPDAKVAVVSGSAQARHAQIQGWKTHLLNHHREIPAALTTGAANVAVVPMLTAIPLVQGEALQPLGLASTILSDPLVSGDVCISIHPGRPELRAQIDAALDEIKRDGRFDRINTKYLPFRLQ